MSNLVVLQPKSCSLLILLINILQNTMIPKTVKHFCSEDPSLIENYELALNDTTQIWDCHHRLETDLGLTADELKEQNKYLNVPASELILLTHSEHTRLHKKANKLTEDHIANLSKSLKGKNKGKKRTPEMINRYKEAHTGTKMMTDGYVQCRVKKEYWGEFIDIGFYFGHISNYGKGKQTWNKGLPKELQPTYGKKIHKK